MFVERKRLCGLVGASLWHARWARWCFFFFFLGFCESVKENTPKVLAILLFVCFPLFSHVFPIATRRMTLLVDYPTSLFYLCSYRFPKKTLVLPISGAIFSRLLLPCMAESLRKPSLPRSPRSCWRKQSWCFRRPWAAC